MPTVMLAVSKMWNVGYFIYVVTLNEHFYFANESMMVIYNNYIQSFSQT